jgi:hypothetical protein
MIINSILITLAVITAAIFLAAPNWYWRIAILSIIQLIGFILILQIWPIALASIKLISGWMGSLLIGYSIYANPNDSSNEFPLSQIFFRLTIIGLIWIFLTINAGLMLEWLPIDYTFLFIGLIFFITGMISFGIFKEPVEIIMGLLVFLAGFDIIYSSLEGSALVTGIYALIIVLISLIGVFMQSSSVELG